MRKISTDRFGEIEVDEEKIVTFENGIPAFEDEREFVIFPYDEEKRSDSHAEQKDCR